MQSVQQDETLNHLLCWGVSANALKLLKLKGAKAFSEYISRQSGGAIDANTVINFAKLFSKQNPIRFEYIFPRLIFQKGQKGQLEFQYAFEFFAYFTDTKTNLESPSYIVGLADFMIVLDLERQRIIDMQIAQVADLRYWDVTPHIEMEIEYHLNENFIGGDALDWVRFKLQMESALLSDVKNIQQNMHFFKKHGAVL